VDAGAADGHADPHLDASAAADGYADPHLDAGAADRYADQHLDASAAADRYPGPTDRDADGRAGCGNDPAHWLCAGVGWRNGCDLGRR
jgi:hypothetical protein